jgi:HK97 family phage portal protein
MANVLATIGSVFTPRAEMSFDAAVNHRSWNDYGPPTPAGTAIGVESSQRVSIWRSCVSLVAQTMAQLPLHLYREVSEGVRNRAPEHPLYSILRERPNSYQDSFEFWEAVITSLILHGNMYARKVIDRRGQLEQLIPIHPEHIRAVEWTQSGTVRYRVKEGARAEETLLGEDMFHIRYNPMFNLVGVSVLSYARHTLGLAAAQDEYNAKFYGNGAHIGGVFEIPGVMSPEAQDRFRATVETKVGGLANAHKFLVIEQGAVYKPLAMTHEDSQFIQSDEHTDEDICRYLLVPPVMVGLTSKATSWGSGIESLGTMWKAVCIVSWVRRIEQAVSRQLLTLDESRTYFPSYVLEGLLRSDTATRYSAYGTARQWGWMSVNEIRRLENMNPIDGGDVYLQPVNMVDANAPPEPADPIPFPDRGAADMPDDMTDDAAARAHYDLLLHDAASRLVRREMAEMRRIATKAAADSLAWHEAVAKFYGEHVATVAETLRISRDAAFRYCEEQTDALNERGLKAIEDWETTRTVALVALARGRAKAAA